MPRKPRLTDEENFRGDKPINNDAPRANGKVSSMPMIDPSELGMEEIHDMYTLPDNKEVELKILQVSRQSRDDGQVYYVCTHEIVGEDFAEEVADFIYMPHPSQTPKQRNKSRIRLRDYASCFNLDIERPFNPVDDWTGAQGWVILGSRKDEKYGLRNTIKEFRRPRN